MANITTGITSGSFGRNTHDDDETYLLPTDGVEHVQARTGAVNMSPVKSAGASSTIKAPASRSRK
jgi:hypothetical protein